MDHLDLSVIIVNWNTRDLLQRCLESLWEQGDDAGQRGRPLAFEVLVVDNASTDGTAKMVAERFALVKLQANETNVGFTRANNQAISLSGGRYVLLLNSDAEIVGKAMETMVAYLDDHL